MIGVRFESKLLKTSEGSLQTESYSQVLFLSAAHRHCPRQFVYTVDSTAIWSFLESTVTSLKTIWMV